MAEYRRFVAYVYEYQKEKKGSNCGFVKIEVRGEICRIELHLQCPGLMPESTCSVYGFVRNRGLLDGILLGGCVTGEGKVECILEISAGDMGDSGKSLDEMGGMIFVTEQGGFFGTEWDDRMIRPGNFRVVEKKMIPETQPDLSETERSSEEEIAESKTEAPEQDRDDRTEQAENVQKEETTQQELHSQSVQESDSSDLVSEEMLHEHDKPHPSCPLPGTPCDAFSDGELSDCRKISPQDLCHLGRRACMCVILDEGPVCCRNASVQESDASDLVSEEMLHEHDKPHPSCPLPGTPCDAFSDGELSDCRKISPQDLCHLGRRACMLRNNRFVQYGSYNFGHLLLCRNKCGQMVLGIPGAYDQQERFMANMFGFPYFKESRHIQIPGGTGGYWYRLIDTPDFNKRDGRQ